MPLLFCRLPPADHGAMMLPARADTPDADADVAALIIRNYTPLIFHYATFRSFHADDIDAD